MIPKGPISSISIKIGIFIFGYLISMQILTCRTAAEILRFFFDAVDSTEIPRIHTNSLNFLMTSVFVPILTSNILKSSDRFVNFPCLDKNTYRVQKRNESAILKASKSPFT